MTAGIMFKHVIVTGGSSGIGKETAKLLARRGANVTLIARRPDVLADARDEVLAACAEPAMIDGCQENEPAHAGFFAWAGRILAAFLPIMSAA